MPIHVSATTRAAITLAPLWNIQKIPQVAILRPSHTRHYNCIITCHGALVTELMPSKPTATELLGESKSLIEWFQP